MLLTISHTTEYVFDRPVPYGLQKLRKTPISRAGQTVIDWQVSLAGARRELAYTDHHNNLVELVSLDPDATRVTIVSEGTVETTDLNGIVGQQGGFVPLWLFLRPTPLTQAGRQISGLVRAIDTSDRLAAMHALSAAILEAVPYRTDDLDVAASAEDAFARGHGVCQDHAHIFIAAARRLSVPARYVSGYLHTGEGGAEAASHAWAEAHVDGLGWVGFDVANAVCPDARYVRVATGFDYRDAAPVAGLVFGKPAEKLVVQVRVEQ